MTVGEMLTRMTATEFDEWMAFSALEPFGETRADIRAALTTAAVTNVTRPFLKDAGDPATWRDFMPFTEPEPEPEQPTEMTPEFEHALTVLLGMPTDGHAV